MLQLRSLSSAVFALTASFTTCFCQTPATFSNQAYTIRSSSEAQAIDVNNDGLLDLVQWVVPQSNGPTTTQFSVMLANGKGGFGNPLILSFSVPQTYGATLASGDFNGDGNVDLLMVPSGGDQIVLFLGNGDGTFKAPKYITVALPSGQQLGSPAYVADFTGDGKLDLVTLATSTVNPGPEALVLLAGDGTGNFGSPVSIYTPPTGDSVNGADMAVGDFDADGKADIAFIENYNCSGEGFCDGALHVLYNNGGGTSFTNETARTFAQDRSPEIAAGDLNSDGLTDIFGVDGYNLLTVLYAKSGRAFDAYTMMTSGAKGTPVMADFNGDGRMDLADGSTTGNGSFSPVFLLAGTSEGVFTQQTYALPTNYGYASLVAGDFNGDGKPDAVIVTSPSSTFPQKNSVINDILNTTAGGNWGGCAYPKAGQGIHVCTPTGSVSSPVSFAASANSFGQLRKLELWVDGKKTTEQYHTWGPRAWFNFSELLAPGSHRGVLFAADIDNRLQETTFNFTVGTGCSAPSSPGVSICAPTNGSSVSSPVAVQAAANVTGTLANMQLWIDGVKKYTVSSASLNTSVTVAAGSHRFAVLAVNTAGQKWESAVTATVQ